MPRIRSIGTINATRIAKRKKNVTHAKRDGDVPAVDRIFKKRLHQRRINVPKKMTNLKEENNDAMHLHFTLKFPTGTGTDLKEESKSKRSRVTLFAPDKK